MRWWRTLRNELLAHKWSFTVSVVVFLLGLALYTHTYLAEAETSLALFVDNIELKTYDSRFRMREWLNPSRPVDDIVIVAIDQKTLDELGAWPFSRLYYVRMLEHLRADGARVIGFDITFPKPDEKSGLQVIRQARRDYLERTPPGRRDPDYLARLTALERRADVDARFAEALRQTERVVLGQFFFMDPSEVEHIDRETLERYESLLAFGAYPQVRPLRGPEGSTPPPLAEIYTGLEAHLAQPNLLAFADATNYTFGYLNFVPDRDAIYRHTHLAIKYKGDFYPSLDVQVLRHYLGVPAQEFGLFYNRAGVEHVQVGPLRLSTDPAGRLLINFQGPARTYRHVSFSDVAQGAFTPGLFRDKIVLVGATTPGIFDVRPVPMDPVFPGVEIHANVIDTLLTQRFLRRGLREELFDLAFIFFFGLVAGVVFIRVPASWSWPVLLGLLAFFLAVTYVAFVEYRAWLNMVVPAGVLVTNFGGVIGFRVLVEERQRRKVHAAFTQYVPPGLIREVLKNPERLTLGGEERELTIMFSDIRGFTALSESLSPLELTHFLNAYTDEMTDILFRHWGTLDKFEGDAIMAFWGAPHEQDDHPLRACAAALDMGKRVDELRHRWRAEGKPDVNIGVGLNTGRVVVGNMGSRKRFNYTVLGDPVNLASRLEGVNKEYSTRILVSEFTYRQATDALGLLVRRLTREFCITPDELVGRDGSSAAHRARQVALYLGSTRCLASPEVLARRFGSAGENAIRAAVAQVELWEKRDKGIARFLADCRRSLHGFLFRQLDWIRVKGRQEPVAIYELLDFAGRDGSPQRDYADLLVCFEAGLQAYRAQNWPRAIDAFQALLEKYPGDRPAQVFLDRCREFQQQPPSPAWDGVYVMKSK